MGPNMAPTLKLSISFAFSYWFSFLFSCSIRTACSLWTHRFLIMSWLPFPVLLSSSFCPASFSCCFFLVLSVSCCCFVADPRFISFLSCCFFFLFVSAFCVIYPASLAFYLSVCFFLPYYACLCPFLLIFPLRFLWLSFLEQLWILPPVAGWIDHCVPKANQDALRKLLGKADVWLLSWVGSDSRDRQVKKDIGQKGHGQEMGTATCREKVGPGGTCHFAWDAGCIAVFDDNMQICKECTELGMEIYPIRTPSQQHGWLPADNSYDTFPEAVEAFLAFHPDL